jgi:hypothetical protein
MEIIARYLAWEIIARYLAWEIIARYLASAQHFARHQNHPL